MNPTKPLEGVKVIEMANNVAAPVAAKMLADWGADVIKIEPEGGDVYRYIGRILSMPVAPGQNPCFDLENANKKSVSIDVRLPEGRAILDELLADANVLITNFRPKALAKLGLTYEEVSEKYPSLVYAVLSGYGPLGPDKDKPGYDLTAFFARSGMMIDAVEAGGSPMQVMAAYGDHITGISLASGICAALYKQKATGKGEKVVSGLYQTSMFGFGSMIAGTHHGLQYPITRHTTPSAITNSYKCKDGEWLLIAATQYDVDFQKLCLKVIDRKDLAENPNFNSTMAMMKNKTELIQILEEIFATKNRDEWETLLLAADIANEKILHWSDVLEDPQAWENGYLREVEYDNGEKSVLVNTPVSFDSVGLMPDFTKAPEIGENTDEVLASLGYTQAQIDELRAAKLIK